MTTVPNRAIPLRKMTEMTEAKRTQLKRKVAAAQKRNDDRGRTTIVDRAGERAIEAKDKLTDFVRAHPVATVAGGLALGVIVSSFFKRSPTRKLGNRAAKSASGLAAIGAQFAMAYAQQAIAAAAEASKTGAEKLDDLSTAARGAGREAADKAGEIGDAARSATRHAGKRLGKALHDRFN
jgi:ElaB/YqjD/DUF883 family membrane-anchored ribosome-binding protein